LPVPPLKLAHIDVVVFVVVRSTLRPFLVFARKKEKRKMRTEGREEQKEDGESVHFVEDVANIERRIYSQRRFYVKVRRAK
jgi:orotate phosphoribosyltransferase